MNETIEPTPRVPSPFHASQARSGVSAFGAQASATSSESPEIFEFDDFRLYLAAWFQTKKQLQPSYSGAMFAKKAGFNSHTLLGMVIRGQRNLSATSIRSFCRALELTGTEATCFEKLVLFNQSRNEEDRAHYRAQLDQARKAPAGGSLALSIDSADLPRVMERVSEFQKMLSAEFSKHGHEAAVVVKVFAAVSAPDA